MTVSKKAAPAKPDAPTAVPPGETPEPSLPVATEIGSPAPADAAPADEPRYRITARRADGFWRCGRKWLACGEELSLSDIGGESVLAALRAEPMLVVHQLGGA